MKAIVYEITFLVDDEADSNILEQQIIQAITKELEPESFTIEKKKEY